MGDFAQVPLSEVQTGGMEGDNQRDNSDSDRIVELEQLYGQKTFTRVEFDRLVELLRSRTIEKVEHDNSEKKKGKTGLSTPPENGIGSSRKNENLSVSGSGSTLARQCISIALPAVKKPAFQIAAPEYLMELDDDDEYLPRPSITPNDDADTKKSKHSDAISVSVDDTSGINIGERSGSEPPPAIGTSNSSSSSVPSAAATFSTAAAFQFGPATSTTASVSFSQSSDQFYSTPIGANSVKASPFDMACSMAQGASSLFPSSSSPDVATTVSIFSGTSPFTSSSLFSSMTGSSSSDPTFPSTESNAYDFNASSAIKSVGSSQSFATSSQNCSATIFGANGGLLSSSPSNAYNFSQNSTASSFGAIGGSFSSTQSKPCGIETSQMPQSSTFQFGPFSSIQFGSFTSSPSFGLANASLGSLGVSPFGSATSSSNHFTSNAGFAFSSSAINSSSFAPAAGNTDFNLGGSFLLGSGGGDKSARKFAKFKRVLRKKS